MALRVRLSFPRSLQESNQPLISFNVGRKQEDPVDFSRTSERFPREKSLSCTIRTPCKENILVRCRPSSKISNPSCQPGKLVVKITRQEVQHCETLLMPTTSLLQEHLSPAGTKASSKRQLPSPQFSPGTKAKENVRPKRLKKASKQYASDPEKSCPVSETIVMLMDVTEDEEERQGIARNGDIDPAFNLVEVSDEVRAELAQIENNIGDYVCRLCKNWYEDAFALAQHSCSSIIHMEYRCPECSKVFSCPANLASHRRWHKPHADGQSKALKKDEQVSSDENSISS